MKSKWGKASNSKRETTFDRVGNFKVSFHRDNLSDFFLYHSFTLIPYKLVCTASYLWKWLYRMIYFLFCILESVNINKGAVLTQPYCTVPQPATLSRGCGAGEPAPGGRGARELWPSPTSSTTSTSKWTSHRSRSLVFYLSLDLLFIFGGNLLLSYELSTNI